MKPRKIRVKKTPNGRHLPAEIKQHVPAEGRWTYTNIQALSHIACPVTA